jgi:hypothetical protein
MAAVDDPYTISNVEVDGDTVTWDHVWTSTDGGHFCQEGHSAVIAGSKILTWVWPVDDFGCR